MSVEPIAAGMDQPVTIHLSGVGADQAWVMGTSRGSEAAQLLGA